MELHDEEVVTEEPQLRYWNPCRRNRNVFTASSVPSVASEDPIQFIKMNSPQPVSCESQSFSSLQASVSDSFQTEDQQEFNCDLSNALLPPIIASESITNGLHSLIPLDTIPGLPTTFVIHQEDGLEKQMKQEPEDEFDESIIHELREDIFTFNNIDEALDSLDTLPTPDSNLSTISFNSLQSNGIKMGLTNEKHEEVVKAAKSLFSKRTRTLYHWLFPDTSKNKLKATVSAAWDTLPEGEKHFYISQVLGRFGLQPSSLMINPQLGGMKCLPSEPEVKCERKKCEPKEDQRAVDSLFDSCEDAGTWASYSEPQPPMTDEIVELIPGRKCPRKRQKNKRENSESNMGQEFQQDLLERPKKIKVHKEKVYKVKVRKEKVVKEKVHKEKIRKEKVHKEKIKKERKYKVRKERAYKQKVKDKAQKATAELEEDPELTKELEKFRLITEAAEEDIWGDIPDPEELFAEINF